MILNKNFNVQYLFTSIKFYQNLNEDVHHPKSEHERRLNDYNLHE